MNSIRGLIRPTKGVSWRNTAAHRVAVAGLKHMQVGDRASGRDIQRVGVC